MKDYSPAELDTLALHAGGKPDPTTGARATPIYQTASYCFPDSDYAAALFNMERPGHVYSRLSNPTTAVLEGVSQRLRAVWALLRQRAVRQHYS